LASAAEAWRKLSEHGPLPANATRALGLVEAELDRCAG
jgi:hypothetical protein